MKAVGKIALCLTVMGVFVWGSAGRVRAETTDSQASQVQPSWWKGNLHTHSFWSDGDAFPEVVAAWYKEHGYQFLSMTDHNVLSRGQRWAERPKGVPVSVLEDYVERFGAAWVEQCETAGPMQVRLKPLSEWRHLFEEPGRFLLIEGEEISGGLDNTPVHVNAINLNECIQPQQGQSVADCYAADLEAVAQQGSSLGRPTLAIVNHPNWSHNDPEHLLPLGNMRFFEVYNAGTGEHAAGDEKRVSTDRLWDILLTHRLSVGPREALIYGVATDDTHNYRSTDPRQALPGRGWVMVRCAYLTPEGIVTALEAGDFYASNGVVLRDVACDGQSLVITIEARPGVEYTTQFIGTPRGCELYAPAVSESERTSVLPTQRYHEQIGQVLAEVGGPQASYTFTGDELYIRAKVISNVENPGLKRPDQREVAWVQPVTPAGPTALVKAQADRQAD